METYIKTLEIISIKITIILGMYKLYEYNMLNLVAWSFHPTLSQDHLSE